MNTYHPIQVTLTQGEWRMAIAVGVERQLAARNRNLPDRHDFTGIGWDIHIEGACGEVALAKALNIHWDGSINTFKRGQDVGAAQVRTRSNHRWELIIRRDDRPEDLFYLVTGVSPHFRVVGFIHGRDGMKDEYLACHGDREPAFFVPQSVLTSVAAR